MATTPETDRDFDALLATGKPVLLKARGNSMYPMIPDGTQVLVAPLAPTARLKIGQVVFARTGQSYLLHRVLKVAGDKVLLKGDWNRAQDGWFARDLLIGWAVCLWRNGERFPLEGCVARRAGLVVSAMIPPLGRLLRLI
jgi:hypothetical protein